MNSGHPARDKRVDPSFVPAHMFRKKGSFWRWLDGKAHLRRLVADMHDSNATRRRRFANNGFAPYPGCVELYPNEHDGDGIKVGPHWYTSLVMPPGAQAYDAARSGYENYEN